jgi:hypothetical protein
MLFSSSQIRTMLLSAFLAFTNLQGSAHVITADDHLGDALNPLSPIMLVPALEFDDPFSCLDSKVPSSVASNLKLPACPCRYIKDNA